MKKILTFCLFLSFSPLALANAVDALKSYIPLFDHSGVNDRYQRCSVDLYRRPGGAVMVDFISTNISKYLVTPELDYEVGPKFYKVSWPSYAESNGTVTMSLFFNDNVAVIERRLCVEDRCWPSTMECTLDRWR